MDERDSASPLRKRLVAAAVAAGTFVGVAGVAGAVTRQSASSSDDAVQVDDLDQATDTDTDSGTDDDGPGAEHHGDRGEETPLTGDLAERVTAAALEAVPGATVDRVEADADGAAYEAHLVDADGNEVNVTFDENLEVVDTFSGMAGHHGGHGGEGPDGQRPDGDGDHRGGHERGGHDETPLTGDLADRVTAAAEAAVPGGTVDRVETDGDGYEAHVTDADGNEVEVHLDQDLDVLEIDQGR